MSGCELPVIINSGSGNQGMATSLPVIVYAKELKATEEQFYGGDGIIVKGVENTIANISRLAVMGMSQTDKEIIQIMVE